MIHEIEIDRESEPVSLKKLFRKKLMTGGAVFRLKPSLSDSEIAALFTLFSGEAQPHNMCSMVLVELAKSGRLNSEQFESLQKLGLANVERQLRREKPFP
jgi:hypothetical protein